MSKLVWDSTGNRYYETGTRNGVIYPQVNGAYPKGYVWDGLTAITESPSGAEATDLYADDIKYASFRSAETFGGTIEAYQFPPEFMECDGTASLADGVYIGQQRRKTFGLSYRTKVGNDVDDELGYKLHLVYGATASPSEKAYQTINESPDAISFSWEFTTTPINVTGHKPTSIITIDSTKVDATKLAALEDILYGTAETEARLPLPDEVATLFSGQATGVTGATGATGATGETS